MNIVFFFEIKKCKIKQKYKKQKNMKKMKKKKKQKNKKKQKKMKNMIYNNNFNKKKE